MNKYLSREFLLTIGLIVIATVFLFVSPETGLVVWAGACGGFLTAYITGKTFQKIKRDPLRSH